MAGIKMRKADRILFENPAIAGKITDFNMTAEAVQHRLFLLRKKAEAAAKKQ